MHGSGPVGLPVVRYARHLLDTDEVKAHIVSDRGGYGGRVTKYKHRFCNTEFGSLKFSPQDANRSRGTGFAANR